MALLKKSMANKVITMQHIRTIIQSLERGFSLRHISRDLKLSRKTVTLYTRSFTKQPIQLNRTAPA